MNTTKRRLLAAAGIFLPLSLFAQDAIGKMTSLAQNIFDIFTSDFVKIILAIFLCGSALAYGFNKDNEKIKRNCIAIGVAAAILIGSQEIVKMVWTASGG